jgi:hypothetical protein
MPALRRSLSHGGCRLRNFTRRRTNFWIRWISDVAASVAACGADSGGLQRAQGKAGEDRVHTVTSEERGRVFIDIYDGFNVRWNRGRRRGFFPLSPPTCGPTNSLMTASSCI